MNPHVVSMLDSEPSMDTTSLGERIFLNAESERVELSPAFLLFTGFEPDNHTTWETPEIPNQSGRENELVGLAFSCQEFQQQLQS